MKNLKIPLMALLLTLSGVAQAEDSISCDNGKTELVITDENEVRFSSQDLGANTAVVKTAYTKKNSAGYPTQLDVTVDDGSDSAYLVFQFGKLNRCEGETSLKVLSAPHFGAPKVIKTVKCYCTQS